MVKKTVFGLTKSAIIERDEQGIVTIKASNRLDIAVGIGFVHAQERFFSNGFTKAKLCWRTVQSIW